MRAWSWMLMAWMVLAGLALSSETALAADPPAGTREVAVEDVGVVAFKKDFFGSLAVTPYSADPSGISEGKGHSKVTIAQGEGVFESDWVDRQVEFVAFRIHKNPAEATAECFFPAIIGSRYARVVRVIDSRNLIVNLEYNGGQPDAPVKSEQVSGYFFIDTAPMLRAMVASQAQPTVYRFKAGQTYVTKGMPNIPYSAKEGAGDMWWLSDSPTQRANLKISAEDAYHFRAKQVAIPDGAYFRLGTHDRSIHLDNLNVLGPTYVVPMVQAQWSATFFTYAQGQCARTLEVRNCDTLAEKSAAMADAHRMPAGASWLAPPLMYSGGGGKRADRGDGVVDITGYQRWHLLRSTWVAWGIGSVKNNDGAGNWIVIDGEEVDDNGRPVHMVYEAEFIKRNRFDDVLVSFQDGQAGDARRVARIEADDFAWPMVENQYWTTGLSTSQTAPNVIDVDGFTLYFGNNGDWRRELGKPNAFHCLINASEARLFDRIPRVGDVIDIEPAGDNTWRIWGWGVQVKDVITINGVDHTIAKRARKFSSDAIMGVKTSGYAHYWDITFEDGQGLPTEGVFKGTIKTSATEHLLDGRPRKVRLRYMRDLLGHWQYNRSEMNYQFRNILFNGMYRQTSGPSNNKLSEYEGIWELPTTKEWVNCVAMESDGSGKGTPAAFMPSEAFGCRALQARNAHPDSLKRDHHILVDGGRLYAARPASASSPVWIRNRPALIYGGASFGGPRFVNPCLLDDKGLFLTASSTGMGLTLTGGYEVDLSNSTFGEPDVLSHVPLRLHGQGTVTLNNVIFHKYRDNQNNGLEVLEQGQPAEGFNVKIKGDGGEGYFRLMGTPGPQAAVQISHWKLHRAMFSKRLVHFSPQWLAMPGFREKVSINGKAGDDINNP